MSDYKVYAAYKQPLVYDENGKLLYVNSNVAGYNIRQYWDINDINYISIIEDTLNIKFPYTLNPTTTNYIRTELYKLATIKFENIIGNNEDYVEAISLDDAIKNNVNFIYPILLYTNDLFENHNTIDIDYRVIDQTYRNKAKICIVQHTEGFFGKSIDNFIWMSNLSKKYKLDKQKFIIITSNMKSLDTYNKLVADGIIEDNFTVYPFPYFQFDIWFNNIGTLSNASNIQKMKKDFEYYKKYNKENKKKYHFLCFNRSPRLHRVCLYSQIVSDYFLKSKSIVTMGSLGARDKYLLNSPTKSNTYKSKYYEIFNSNIKDDYKFSKNKVLNFMKDYDDTIDYLYDSPDFIENKALILNKKAHSDSFVNIVTETEYEDYTIFFSEKIYKPIYMLQPFIVFGNPGSLRVLKELGFKTFSDWWDESYDDEIDFTRKMEKVTEILYKIAEWDIDTLYNKTQEMEEILIHNFNNLINIKPVNDLFNFLSK